MTDKWIPNTFRSDCCPNASQPVVDVCRRVFLHGLTLCFWRQSVAIFTTRPQKMMTEIEKLVPDERLERARRDKRSQDCMYTGSEDHWWLLALKLTNCMLKETQPQYVWLRWLHKKYDIQDLGKLTLKASHHECRIIQVEGKRRLLDCRKIWEMQ